MPSSSTRYTKIIVFSSSFCLFPVTFTSIQNDEIGFLRVDVMQIRSEHHQRSKQTLSWVNSKYDNSLGGPLKQYQDFLKWGDSPKHF